MNTLRAVLPNIHSSRTRFAARFNSGVALNLWHPIFLFPL